MIKRSKEVGCWASKFQIFTQKEAPNLPKHLYLSNDDVRELFEYGKSINHIVFFTPMYDCIYFLDKLGVEYYKIRYKDRYNVSLIKKILNTCKPFFISFDKDDIYLANASMQFPKQMFMGMTLLCVPKYPASFEDYGNIITFGYSDHTPDLQLFKYARNNSARWFEKHVKLEGTKPLENDWSISFKELREVIK